MFMTGVFLGGVVMSGAEVGDAAGVAYPGDFSRPPAAGTSYDTWEGASGADVGAVKVDLVILRLSWIRRYVSGSGGLWGNGVCKEVWLFGRSECIDGDYVFSFMV